MSINKFTCQILRYALFVLLVVVTSVFASGSRQVGDKFAMNIKISGTVVATGSCTFVVTGKNTVNFGDIRFNTVNGVNTLETSHVTSLLQNTTDMCTGDVGGKVQMRLDSTQGNDYVTYQNFALLPVYNGTITKKYTSLGIMLNANGVTKNCGQWFDVDPMNLPNLTVSLLQIGDGSDLQSDSILSTATLTIAFN
ncbi:TPA: hypothetical protein ROG05_004069 [Enterobacter soli]|nr:hypothetical protein [Enterobacter soli]